MLNLSTIAGFVLPGWARWLAIGAALYALFLLGQLHGERVAGEKHNAYVLAQVGQAVKIVTRQVKVAGEIQTKYVDRIQKIYLQGAEIEKHITDYVQPADDDRFGVNVGFLRNIDAAWAGVPVGPAVDSDREPAGVPLSEIGVVEVENATSCLVWRKQALGWREFYASQQIAINGKAGAWSKAALEPAVGAIEDKERSGMR